MIKCLVAATLAVSAISNVLKSGTINFSPSATVTGVADEKLDTYVSLTTLSYVTI